MPVFAYKALDPAGEQNGTIAADTPRQARDLLRERGLIVRDLATAATPASATRRPRRPARAVRTPVTSFIHELSPTLAVGVPLLAPLETLARQHKGKFHTIILLLRDKVAAGSSLG